MNKLLIVESPSKAKTISKYLGAGYTVRASVGHIRDLPKSNKKAIDIENGFIPHYEVPKEKEHIVSELKKESEKASDVLLATDPDREGEAIAWHISQALDLKKAKRVAFYEITESAIKEALTKPRDIDENLRRAQEARRVLDRLVGYDLSGIIWKKVRYGLSAGRVQSPALRIIMEREREIRAFNPEKYWHITAKVDGKDRTPFILECSKEPENQEESDRILEVGKKEKWKVVDITESEAKRSPKAPFTTSTLQQTASTRLGFPPSKTMGVAQKLYEAGLITYMRTDSTTLGKEAKSAIASQIEKQYGKDFLSMRDYKTKTRNAQEAHEAVRPTNMTKSSAGNTEDQKRLYRLIWQRTMASQMTDAKILRTKISANVESLSIPEFSTTGSRTIFEGWLKADPEAKGEEKEVPKVSREEALRLINIDSEEKETQPPSRYTEAGLIKELEKRGIGRPSTYASIMKTIVDRDYATREGRTLFPTDTGEVVSDFLENNFAKYISDSFTADMEQELDDISNGKREYEKTLKEFYTPFSKEVKEKEKLEKATTLGDAPENIKCPKCDARMVIKLGKSGKFLSCSRFPDCDGARTMEGRELEGPKEIGENCPKCKDGKLVEREGKYGKFISCNKYPKCKYVKSDEKAEKARSTGIRCPICNKGEMTERKGRFGMFFSCSNYPECKHAIKAKPTGNQCPMCESLMMEGTKTIPERCSNKKCPNHNPHKLDKK